MIKMIVIEDNNFNSAWARLIHQIILFGNKRVIGDINEPKNITDEVSIIELYGNAIKEIENREMHPQYPFKLIDEYLDEFTYEFDHSKFVYTAMDRMFNREIDQLTYLRFNLKEQIETGISSNRGNSVLWDIFKDTTSGSPICPQRVWIKHIKDKNVEVHLTWRSRDAFSAWQADIISMIYMVNKYVIKPNNAKIIRIIDYCDSIHIYDGDMDYAKRIKLVPKNPQMR